MVRCSYLTGVEKGISAFPAPCKCYPTANYHSRGCERKGERRRGSQRLLNVLSIKSVQGFGWVWLGRLGFCRRAHTHAHTTNTPYISRERTPDQMETIQTELAKRQPPCFNKKQRKEVDNFFQQGDGRRGSRAAGPVRTNENEM